jgi:hypothetical protein
VSSVLIAPPLSALLPGVYEAPGLSTGAGGRVPLKAPQYPTVRLSKKAGTQIPLHFIRGRAAFCLDSLCGRCYILPDRRSNAVTQIASLKPYGSNRNKHSSSRSPLFFIGRDRHGFWTLRDQSGTRGGLFANLAEAYRFALFESGNCPQAIVEVPGFLELDMSASPKTAANDAA